MLLLILFLSLFEDERWICRNGEVYFKSDAKLELIEANSSKLQGIINPNTGEFAFSVEMNSFEGFNSALQKEHFNENYLESPKFPKASFKGKIIEKVDFEKEGKSEIRAKGKLFIHGIEQERIILSKLDIKGNKIKVSSFFTVVLNDHNIVIPKIVNQKIAEEIQVNINAQFVKK